MDSSGTLKFLFGFFMFIGIGGILTTSAIPAAMGQKLSPSQYAAQVFFPSTVSLLFILAAYVGFSFMDYDEQLLQYMLIASSCGAILISLLSISLSWNRIRYAAF
jgi:hypothetical protein